MERNKILWHAVDLDNTLTEETCWNEEQMLSVNPRMEVVEKVREAYENYHHIVIHTSRLHKFYYPTIVWLKKHNIPYHSIAMEKMPADIYWDDKSINPLHDGWESHLSN